MGLGQMLMALLATVLLSMLILNMNKNSLLMEANIDEYKVKEIAVSLAQSIIDDAQNKKFDESSVGFTAIASLGIDAGTPTEIANNPDTYDDFDDYHGYTNTTTSDTLQLYTESGQNISRAIFRIKCSVSYVDLTDLDLAVNYTTRYKRLAVSVWSDAYINPFTNKPDTIKLSTICGDWDPNP